MGAVAPGSAHAGPSPQPPINTSRFFSSPNLIFLCDLNPLAKFQNAMITPSGRKASETEREK